MTLRTWDPEMAKWSIYWLDSRRPGQITPPVKGGFAKGARDMIVVFPDSKTIHNGSMYSSSATTGDFETFISRDLIRYIEGLQ